MPKITSKIETYNGRPSIFINEKPVAPMIYALTDLPGGRWSWEEVPQHNIKQFYNIGIRMFQLTVFLDDIWFEDGTFDIDKARKQIKGVVGVCKDAAIILRLYVNAPKWWISKYPEESVVYDSVKASSDLNIGLVRYLEADPRNPVRFSLASKKWLRQSSEKVRSFCKLLSNTPEGNVLAGIQVASGLYGEWHQWGFLKYEADFSKPMANHFRQWLKTRYKSDSSLQKSWNNPKSAFINTTIPNTTERGKTSAGIFRDPVNDQRVIDYYDCQHELVANNIIHFCKIIKESWPEPIITGSHYGYFFSLFHRQAAGGHLAVHKILKSEHIDFISGPQVYYPESEHAGQPYRSRGLLHSALLNGKLWLDEMDQQPKRTFQFLNGNIDNRKNYQKNITENISLIKRNIMYPISKGMGLWFYDFGPAGMNLNPENETSNQAGISGYWDNPEYLKAINQIKTIAGKQLKKIYSSDADVLLVYDTRVMKHLCSTGDGDPVTHKIIDQTSLACYYSGVVFDVVYINDLNIVDFKQYKTIVFANTFVLDDEQKKIISERIKKENRHILWIYASGYSNGKIVNPDFVSQITGIHLNTTEINKTPVVVIDKSIGNILVQTPEGQCTPLFKVNDKNARPYGYFKSNNNTAFAKKRLNDHTSWYIAVPPTDPGLMRYIFECSGAHIYHNTSDIIYSGNGIITYHTKNGGKRLLKLKNGKAITLDLPKQPTTVLIDSETGEEIV